MRSVYDSTGVLRHMSAVIPPSPHHALLAPPLVLEGADLPDAADTRTLEPFDIVDQGAEGRCVGMALSGAMNQLLRREGVTGARVSGQFIYDIGRINEGFPVTDDRGMVIADGVQILIDTGVPDEDAWPFTKPVSAIPPPESVIASAHHKLDLEFRCPDRLTMLASIAQGFAVVGAIDCYESFMSGQAAATGEIPDPEKGEKLVGPHAIIFAAYDAVSKLVFFRNSWGDWGRAGFGVLSFKYVDTYAFDMHSMRLAERK